jgi:hypothetical protein
LQIGELGLPAGLDALGARLGKAGIDPLADHVPLELRERCDDVELEHSATRRRVDGLGKAFDLDAPLAQSVEETDDADERSAETIKFPDEEGVTFPGWACRAVSPGRLILKYPLSAGLVERANLVVEILIGR